MGVVQESLSYWSTANVRLSLHTEEGGRVHGNRGTTRGRHGMRDGGGTQDCVLLALFQDCLLFPASLLEGPRSRFPRLLRALLLVGVPRAARSSLSARLGFARVASPRARTYARLRSGSFGWRCVRSARATHAPSLSPSAWCWLGFGVATHVALVWLRFRQHTCMSCLAPLCFL